MICSVNKIRLCNKKKVSREKIDKLVENGLRMAQQVTLRLYFYQVSTSLMLACMFFFKYKRDTIFFDDE